MRGSQTSRPALAASGGRERETPAGHPPAISVGFGVAMSQALGPFSLRAGVASSTLGIAQVCGSSLWIWLAAVVGIGAWNMLIGILIACSIVSLLLIMFVAPGRPVAAHEEIHHHA